MLIFCHRLLCSGGIEGGHFNYPAGAPGGARYNWFTYSPEDTFVWNEEAGSYGIGKENGKSGRGSASLVILHLLNRACGIYRPKCMHVPILICFVSRLE